MTAEEVRVTIPDAALEASVQPQVGVRAMCLACGALRVVSPRFSLANGRVLHCDRCGRTTRHRAADATGPDFREEDNQRKPSERVVVESKERRLARHENFLLDMFERLGIDVRVKPRLTRSGKPAIYTVDRWEMPGSDRIVWRVTILDYLTPAGRGLGAVRGVGEPDTWERWWMGRPVELRPPSLGWFDLHGHVPPDG